MSGLVGVGLVDPGGDRQRGRLGWLADEALGRNGGARHADTVALGEADETWPRIVEDAARGGLVVGAAALVAVLAARGRLRVSLAAAGLVALVAADLVLSVLRIDAILPTLGGQTALNCACKLWDDGTLQEFGIEMIGASRAA